MKRESGLPSDRWRYCQTASHSVRLCSGCGEYIGFKMAQAVEHKVVNWRHPEHWHAHCALEEALRILESNQPPPLRAKYHRMREAT